MVENTEAIYFYNAKDETYGCFSNFSPHPFELEGVQWPTSEHCYQAHKFVGTPHFEEIRLAKTSKEAAQMGRDLTRPLREDWEQVKDEVMRIAVLKKFETHPDLQGILLATGDQQIIENSPTDYYLGIGANRNGQNKLGQILMEVRGILRKRG